MTTAGSSSSIMTPTAPRVQQPKPQTVSQSSRPSAIQVSTRQKGNPILSHVSALPWEYADTPADYVLGQITCALFLSLKYHRLHPEYIYSRIRLLSGKYNLRILIAMVDIENHEDPLRELAKTSLVNNFTLILCWSAREAARYLEAFKALEHADGAEIKGAKSNTFVEQMQEFMTTPRTVNKTDAISLVGGLGSVRNAVNAGREEILAIPGWGGRKAERFLATINEPFKLGPVGRGAGHEVSNIDDQILRINRITTSGDDKVADNARDGVDYQARREVNRHDGYSVNGQAPVPEPVTGEQAADLAANETTQAAPIFPKRLGEQEVIQTNATALFPLRNRPEEPQLSNGVEAALALLRKQGTDAYSP